MTERIEGRASVKVELAEQTIRRVLPETRISRELEAEAWDEIERAFRAALGPREVEEPGRATSRPLDVDTARKRREGSRMSAAPDRLQEAAAGLLIALGWPHKLRLAYSGEEGRVEDFEDALRELEASLSPSQSRSTDG